jgi:hypothetical protein
MEQRSVVVQYGDMPGVEILQGRDGALRVCIRCSDFFPPCSLRILVRDAHASALEGEMHPVGIGCADPHVLDAHVIGQVGESLPALATIPAPIDRDVHAVGMERGSDESVEERGIRRAHREERGEGSIREGDRQTLVHRLP